MDLGSATVANNTFAGALQSVPAAAILSPTNAILTAPAVITVQGTAAEGNGILGVTVNGIAASSSDGFAHWSATVPIALGTNTMTALSSVTVVGSLDANGTGLPDAWETQYGVTGGALGDPSHTGIPNLLAYALNLNPNAPDRSLLPLTSVQTKPADGLNYLTFSYRRRIGGGGVTCTVDVSSDLIGWTPGGFNIEEVSAPVPNADGITETETVRLLPSLHTAGSRRFMRLRVTSP